MTVKAITTPTGEVQFAKIDTPDTKFNPIGVYTITVAFSGDALEEFNMMLDPTLKLAKKETGTKDLNLPIRIQEDGSAHVTMKVKASGVVKATGEEFENVVKVEDAGQQPLDTKLIGKGSKVKVVFEPVAYSAFGDNKAGVTFRLKKVQVIKLVPVETKATKMGTGKKETLEIKF